MYKAANDCASTLAAGITDSGTTLTIQTADTAKFPIINQGGSGTDYTYLTLEDAALNVEIVKVTRHDNGSSSITIARAQEGTVARAWQAGDSVALRLTAGVVTDAFARAYDAGVSETAAAASATAAAQSLADINALATQVGASIADDGLITSAASSTLDDGAL